MKRTSPHNILDQGQSGLRTAAYREIFVCVRLLTVKVNAYAMLRAPKDEHIRNQN